VIGVWSDGVVEWWGEAPWQPWVCAKKTRATAFYWVKRCAERFAGMGNRLDRDDQLSITQHDFF
jgi:hypothetical protein